MITTQNDKQPPPSSPVIWISTKKSLNLPQKYTKIVAWYFWTIYQFSHENKKSKNNEITGFYWWKNSLKFGFGMREGFFTSIYLKLSRQCSWHFFCQIRPFFDNFVIFKPKLQQFIRLIFSFLSYSREIYNSISTHFIDFPQNIAMRVLWFLQYFCKKDYFFVILSFSNQNYDSISVFFVVFKPNLR